MGRWRLGHHSLSCAPSRTKPLCFNQYLLKYDSVACQVRVCRRCRGGIDGRFDEGCTSEADPHSPPLHATGSWADVRFGCRATAATWTHALSRIYTKHHNSSGGLTRSEIGYPNSGQTLRPLIGVPVPCQRVGGF